MTFNRQSQRSHICNIPLQWVMVVPFVVQIIGAVGLLSSLSNYYWTICICGIMLISSMVFAVLANRWISQLIEHIEISLKESEEKYKVLFEILPIGISITDPEGNLIEGNPASEAILTVPTQELIERTYDSHEWEIVRFDGSLMPTSEYASVRALTENRQIDNVKMGLLDDHGNVRWLSVSAAPIPLKEYGVAIAYVDISTLKHTEEALRKSQAVLNSFLDNAPTPISIKNLEGTYLSINKEFVYLMQMSKEEIVGKKDQDFFPDKVITRLRSMEKQAIFEGIAISFEQTIQLPDGAHTFIMTKFPIIDEQNKVQSLAGIYLDISDRKRAELELAYNHDLREEIYNGSVDAIFLVDPFTLLIFDCNRCAVQMFEADSKQELIGIEGQTLQKYKFTEAQLRSINDDIEEFGYWSQETEYITKKGKYFWGNLVAKMITVAGREMNLVRVTDISDRKRAEIILQESEARFQKIANISPEVIYIFVLQPNGLVYFEYVSVASEEIFGITRDDLIRNPDLTLSRLHPNDVAAYQEDFQKSLLNMEIFQHEWRIITPQGVKWIKAQARPELRANGDVAWYGFAFDISDRKQADLALAQTEAELRRVNLELQKLVNLDGLTQIANRRCFDERIVQEWQRLNREQQPLSLLMFDVDYFKRYNDHYGHQLGDECLVKIAQTVDFLMCRAADLVARYGGEEFIVILPNTNIEGAIAVAKRIHAAIADLKIPHQCSDVGDFVSVSMGIASDMPSLERSPCVLINQADQALYYAKQKGRNQSVVFMD